MLSEKYIVKLTFYKKKRVLNNDSQQFQKYQQNEQSHLTELKKDMAT